MRMYGSPAQTRPSGAARSNSIDPGAGASPAAEAPRTPAAIGGELTPGLLREWGPLLKPAGIGLLVALHSFEETTPGHSFFGWAHCTQNALAAYLDTSQDSIARYSNLLQTCGLLQVEEVETPRGKQKLYRVRRDAPLPSLALLEYLVFDADNWTRKHTAWLTGGVAALGAETEITRLTAIMRRAYHVQIDARGLAALSDGARLTRPGSYLGRTPPAARQLGFPAAGGAPAGTPRGADSPLPGAAPRVDATRPAPPSASSGFPGGPAPAQMRGESASSGVLSSTARPGVAGAGADSAWSGSPDDSHPLHADRQDSAESGLPGRGPTPAGTAPAPDGGAGAVESAESGLAAANNVTVSRLSVKDESNGNDNEAGPPGSAWSGGPPPGDPEALIRWGAALLSDGHSLEWHRRCVASTGEELYRWAVEATCRAQARGKVSKPGAYFTSLLRRRGGPGPGEAPATPPPARQPSAPQALTPTAATAPGSSPASAPDPPAAPSPSPTALPPDEAANRWQAALVYLRVGLPPEDYSRILRYAAMLELDPAGGWALLGLPTDHMREQVEARLAAPISQALAQICGRTIRVVAVVLPGQGRLGGGMPTLAEQLAARSPRQQKGPADET
jgi:hypothetical protein